MTTATQTKTQTGKRTKATDPGVAAASAAPAPPPEPTRFILTNAIAQQALERRTAVHDFDLTATMPGAVARVQYVDLNHPGTLSALPETLLRAVLGMANDLEIREGTQEAPEITRYNPDGTLNVEGVIRLAQIEAKAADAYCLAGFVEPALILTEGERVRDDQVLLQAIHPVDRRRFGDWCNGPGSEASETVLPFPDGPDEGLAAGGPGGVDGGPAE